MRFVQSVATQTKVHLFGAIEKFDTNSDGSLIVTGIASSEDVDSQGEIISAGAMREAIPNYLQKGSVREMHQPSAVGVPISAFVDTDGKTHFTAHIVDRDAIEKVKAGVYKGFSIAGKALERAGKTVTKLLLKTIDLVDIPSNPSAYFTVIKFDKPGEYCTDPQCKNHNESAVKKCAECVSKSEHEKNMSTELTQKVDSLADTVAKLAKSIESFKPAELPKVKIGDAELNLTEAFEKVLGTVGDLKKRADEAVAAASSSERSQIIAKMSTEARVALKDDGTAYKLEELEKMDIPLLKFAARNSQVLPTIAKSVFTSTGAGPEANLTGPDGKRLTGSTLTAKAWEADYGDLEKMLASPLGQTN